MDFNCRWLLETLKFNYLGNDIYEGVCKVILNKEICTIKFITNALQCKIDTKQDCFYDHFNNNYNILLEEEVKMLLPFLKKNNVYFTITKE